MKNIFTLMLCLVLMTGCSAKEVRTDVITVGNTQMTVIYDEDTYASGIVTDGKDEYRFENSGEIKILYPDGATYNSNDAFEITWMPKGTPVMKDNAAERGYISGKKLSKALMSIENIANRFSKPELGRGIGLILIGGLMFGFGTLMKYTIKDKQGDRYAVQRHYNGRAQFSGGFVMLLGFIVLIFDIIGLFRWYF